MMGNRLERYIGGTILINVLLIAFIILCLASLFAFIDQLGDFKNNYTVFEAIKYVILTAPRRTYDTLPMASLVGSLIGLGALASRSELTIMRAAGMSTGRIVFAVLKPIFIIMIMGVLAGEYVIPYSETKAIADKELALTGNGVQQHTLDGVWHRQGHEYIHIASVQPNGLLLGVTRYYKEGQQINYASFSKTASFQKGKWQLNDTTTTYFEADHTRVVTTPTETWDAEVTPELLNTVNSDPSNLALDGLWQYIHYLNDQGLNNDNYWLAFLEKLLQPLQTLALVVLAISFIFGPLRSVTMGQRIFTGVVIGFVFKIAQSLLGPASLVFHFPPLLAVFTPILLCLFVGIYLLKQKR